MNQDNLPLSMRCTAHDILYNRISTALGLPCVAGAGAWSAFDRQIARTGIPRGVIGGVVMYGIEATYIPRSDSIDSIAFPSGTVATLSEGKVTSIQRDPEIVQGVGAVPEIQPLPYFTERKAFDPFGPEFVVVSSTQAQPAAPVHPLQRDGAGAVFGSAYLI
jgi:hypothetical protein